MIKRLFLALLPLCLLLSACTAPTVPKVLSDYADKHGIPLSAYPDSLIELLQRNPETAEFVCRYPEDLPAAPALERFDRSQGVPLFLQWDTAWGYEIYGSDVLALTGCGPTCLAMVGFYLTGDSFFSPDQVADFAWSNDYYAWRKGSKWTLISEGSRRLGLNAVELPLHGPTVLGELEAGKPIICVVGPGDFTTEGHFIVLTGLENGMIRVNDPNSLKNSRKLWPYEVLEPQILNLWAMEVLP